MFIRIDQSTGVPLWLQIVNQLTKQVVSRNIAVGDRLPTVRELAADLRVNPNTVARAYQELEREGVVETRRGQGTFACDVVDRRSPAQRRSMIADQIDALLADTAHLKLTDDELRAIFDERLRASDRPKPNALPTFAEIHHEDND
jgi:GntR family transcriptional regulator